MPLWEGVLLHPPLSSAKCFKNRPKKKRGRDYGSQIPKEPSHFLLPRKPLGREKGLGKGRTGQGGWTGKGWRPGCDALTERKEALEGKSSYRCRGGASVAGLGICRKNTTRLSESSPDTQLPQEGPARRNWASCSSWHRGLHPQVGVRQTWLQTAGVRAWLGFKSTTIRRELGKGGGVQSQRESIASWECDKCSASLENSRKK